MLLKNLMIKILHTVLLITLLINLILQTCNQGLISKINLSFVNEETGGVVGTLALENVCKSSHKVVFFYNDKQSIIFEA